jgi:hypothetical protein
MQQRKKFMFGNAVMMALLGSVLFGCKRTPEPAPVASSDAVSAQAAMSAESASSSAQAAPPPTGLFKEQRDALNKAKALEGQMQQQAADRMKAMEEATK